MRVILGIYELYKCLVLRRSFRKYPCYVSLQQGYSLGAETERNINIQFILFQKPVCPDSALVENNNSFIAVQQVNQIAGTCSSCQTVPCQFIMGGIDNINHIFAIGIRRVLWIMVNFHVIS